MSSLSYLVQDSDLYLEKLLKVLETNVKDLPIQLSVDKTGSADRNKITIFQLLESLSKKNMGRLLARAQG